MAMVKAGSSAAASEEGAPSAGASSSSSAGAPAMDLDAQRLACGIVERKGFLFDSAAGWYMGNIRFMWTNSVKATCQTHGSGCNMFFNFDPLVTTRLELHIEALKWMAQQRDHDKGRHMVRAAALKDKYAKPPRK